MEIYVISNIAFMILETPIDFDWDSSFGKLTTYDRQSEWEEFVSPFQQVKEGQMSTEKWQLMERIFSMKESLQQAAQ